jgi:hypothetical protein
MKVDKVLFTTAVSAEGNFIAHIPKGLRPSISDPLGGGPGICITEETFDIFLFHK